MALPRARETREPMLDELESGFRERVTPRRWIGFAVWALSCVVVFAVQKAMGVPYDQRGASAENLWRAAVLSLAVGGLLMAALTSVFGWWRPAMLA